MKWGIVSSVLLLGVSCHLFITTAAVEPEVVEVDEEEAVDTTAAFDENNTGNDRGRLYQFHSEEEYSDGPDSSRQSSSREERGYRPHKTKSYPKHPIPYKDFFYTQIPIDSEYSQEYPPIPIPEDYESSSGESEEGYSKPPTPYGQFPSYPTQYPKIPLQYSTYQPIPGPKIPYMNYQPIPGPKIPYMNYQSIPGPKIPYMNYQPIPGPATLYTDYQPIPGYTGYQPPAFTEFCVKVFSHPAPFSAPYTKPY